MRKRLILCAVFAVLAACANDVIPATSPNTGKRMSEAAAVVARNAARAGFDTTGAQEIAGHLVVETDIAIPIGVPPVTSLLPNAAVNPQARLNVAVRSDFNTVRLLRINLNALQSRPAWLQGTRRAINNWNAIRGSAVRLQETTGSANITVNIASLATNVYARAQYPTSSFSVGSWIQVNAFSNVNPYGSLNPPATEQIVSNMSIAMSHEIGHTIGMLHTNSWQSDVQGGELVPGTTSSDASSVLWSTTPQSAYWNGFSLNDIFAIRTTWLGYGPTATAASNTLYWTANDPEAISYKIVRWYWYVPPNTNEQYPEGLGYSEIVANLAASSSSYLITAGSQGCDRSSPHYLYGVAAEYAPAIVTRVQNVADCFTP